MHNIVRNGLAMAMAGFVLLGTAGAEVRTWTSGKGTQLQAEFSRVEGEFVYLKAADGAFRKIRFDSLVEADKQFIAQILKPPADPAPAVTPAPPTAAAPGDIPERRHHRPEHGLPVPEAAPKLPANVLANDCRADSQWSYLAYLPADYTRDRKWPVLYVILPMRPTPEIIWYLEKAHGAFRGLIVVPSNFKWNTAVTEEGQQALRAVMGDVRERYNIDPAREFLHGSGNGGALAMAKLGEDRPAPYAGIILVNSYEHGALPRGLNSKTVVAAQSGAPHFTRHLLSRLIEPLKNNPNRFELTLEANPTKDEFTELLMWTYTTWLKQSTEPNLAEDRAQHAARLLAEADALRNDNPEMAFKYVEQAASMPTPPAVQVEVSKRMNALSREPVVQQFVAARKDFSRIVEKYLAQDVDDWRFRRDSLRDMRRDLERIVEKYPGTSVKRLAEKLLGNPRD